MNSKLLLWKSDSAHEPDGCNTRKISGSSMDHDMVLQTLEDVRNRNKQRDDRASEDEHLKRSAQEVVAGAQSQSIGAHGDRGEQAEPVEPTNPTPNNSNSNSNGNSSGANAIVDDAMSFANVQVHTDVVDAFIQTFHSRRLWKYIQISQCHGEVNDLIATCMMSASSNTSIQHFALQSNINLNTAYLLSYGLKYTSSLLSLSLSTHLTMEFANAVSRALSQNTTVTTFSLAGSTIDANAILPLSFGIRINTTVRSFILDNCKLKDDQLARLLISLQYHPSIRVLSLRHNHCHNEGMSAVAALLHLDQLHELDLSYLERPERKKVEPKPQKNGNDGPTKQDQTKNDSDGAADSQQQASLDADGSGEMGKEGNAKKAAQPNQDSNKDDKSKRDEDADERDNEKVVNRSLEVLQLAGNNLSDTYVSSLLGIFGDDSQLEEINLFGNRISDFGVRKILRLMPKLSKLRTIWLGQNPFSTKAAESIADCVQSNYRLQEVSILNMDGDPRRKEIQQRIDHSTLLNLGGRRIYAEAKDKDKHGSRNHDRSSSKAATDDGEPVDASVDGSAGIPHSLWPHILSRANEVPTWLSAAQIKSYTADVIFTLLHGPVLFEHPDLMR